MASSTYSAKRRKTFRRPHRTWAAHLAPFILPTPALNLIIVLPSTFLCPRPLQSLSHTSAPSRHPRGIQNLPGTAVDGSSLQPYPSGSTHLLLLWLICSHSHHPHQYLTAPPLSPSSSIQRRYKHLLQSAFLVLAQVLHHHCILVHVDPPPAPCIFHPLTQSSDLFPNRILSPLKNNQTTVRKNQQVALFKRASLHTEYTLTRPFTLFSSVRSFATIRWISYEDPANKGRITGRRPSGDPGAFCLHKSILDSVLQTVDLKSSLHIFTVEKRYRPIYQQNNCFALGL